jgi:acetylornithine/N-succinyldiaminopimelate aminotransferase
MSTAKGIGGGFPLGAVFAREAVGKYLVPGTHGTTFGGNPLACTAGNVVLDVLLAPGFLDDVVRKGLLLTKVLDGLVADFPGLFEARRGRGLFQGLKCIPPAAEVQGMFTAEGLMTATGGENVVRLMPALVVTDADIAEAGTMMRRAAGKRAAASKAAAE